MDACEDRLRKEITALKRELAARTEEMEIFRQRCDRMQRLFSCRPEELRQIGELQIEEIMEKHKALAQQETELRLRQGEAEKLEEERRQSLEQRAFLLDQRERTLALRQKKLEESSKSLRGSMEEVWAGEKGLLLQDLEDWKQKAQSALEQLAQAKKEMARMEGETRFAHMEREAGALRIGDWERKAAEIDALRRELEAREERCTAHEESLSKREAALKFHTDNLGVEYSRKRDELEKLKERMKLEVNELTRRYQGGGDGRQ